MLRTADKRLFLGELSDLLPRHRRTRHVTYGDVAASSAGTTVTASGLNTKGSWVQLVASTDFDADGFYLTIRPGLATIQTTLVDIGIGGAGSEVVILENFLYCEGSVVAGNHTDIYIPLPIDAGTRIAARCQSSDNNGPVTVTVAPVAGDFYAPIRMRRATTYGAATGDSGGVQVDPGGSANTKGAWAEISAAITNPIRYALILTGNQNAGLDQISWLMDIGTGAGGAEAVVLDDLHMFASNTVDVMDPGVRSRAVSIPAGTRLAARAQASGIGAGREFDVVVIGFD